MESYVLRNKINSPSQDKTAAQPNVFRLLVLSMRRSTCPREITAKVIADLITPHYFSRAFLNEVCPLNRLCLVLCKKDLTLTMS
jgi:hypothetical protein